MSKELIPIVLFVGAFALTYGLRYFSNKEKMAMIERGMDPGLSKTTPKPFVSLRFGLLFIGVGLGLFVALLTVRSLLGNNLSDGSEGQAVAIYFGSILFFGGIGLVVSYLIEKRWLDQQG